MLRPNFTDISWDGSNLRVKGQSDPGEVSHIRGIVVTLSQKHDRGDSTISRPVIVETPSGSVTGTPSSRATASHPGLWRPWAWRRTTMPR